MFNSVEASKDMVKKNRVMTIQLYRIMATVRYSVCGMPSIMGSTCNVNASVEWRVPSLEHSMSVGWAISAVYAVIHHADTNSVLCPGLLRSLRQARDLVDCDATANQSTISA